MPRKKKEEAKKAEEMNYDFKADHTTAKVRICKKPDDRIFNYEINIPQLEEGTMAFLDDIKTKLLKEIKISQEEALDIRMAEQLRLKFIDIGKRMIKEQMPDLTEEKLEFIAERVVQEMLGLGDIEFLLRDDYIEEICVNTAAEPIWVYHRKFGWLKSNLRIPNEYQVLNYASSIARKVGRQINVQNPLLDAYLVSGDRVNATTYPISAFGNTITIRKFAREPWTITDYMKLKTISSDVAALLWLAMQYEMSLIVAGGTGSGKTSFLNVLSAFIPQNQRIVSIEQTRELSLPSYYQWVPLVVRELTSEGRGEVSMLDLMINSLRMRPDRILIGEIRRAEEAQVLFEAMHTGHSVYATLHAETVAETFRRLKNPPINIPGMMLSSLHLIVAMYRDKRRWIRRMFELGEILPSENEHEEVKAHILYKWKAKGDSIVQVDQSRRIMDYIKTFTNLDDSELRNTLKERKEILDYLVKKDIKTVDGVGDIISRYYDNPDAVIKMIRK